MFKIGADPEFFLKKDGKFVSAYGMIEGTKTNPQKVKGGAVQVDGMALEFNIDPVDNFEDFNDNINSVLGALRAMIPKEYEFAFVPVAHFDADYINNQPIEARRLGCDPDFNAYTGKPNPIPDASKTFRTASGHIHIGWDENLNVDDAEHIEACRMMTKQLDIVLGNASLIIDPDTTRRQLYGKAGAFRPKSYGVEYRVMSNAWVENVNLRRLVFYNAKHCFDKLLKGTQFYRMYDGQAYINRPKLTAGIFDNAYYITTAYWFNPGKDAVKYFNDLYNKNKANLNKTDAQLALEKKEALKAEAAKKLDKAAWNWDGARKFKRDAYGRFA